MGLSSSDFRQPAALLAASALLGLPGPSGSAAAQDVTLTPETTLRGDEGSTVETLDFSSDGRLLLVGDDQGRLAVRSLDSGRRLSGGVGPVHGAAVLFAAFMAGDTAVVSVDEEGTVLVHRMSGGELARPPAARLETGDEPIRAALDAGRRYLAVATEAPRVELFDLHTRQRLGTVDPGEGGDEILHLGFDRPGRQLVAVTAGGRVTAWNPANLETLRRVTLQGDDLHGSRSTVHAVDADRGANVLVVALEEVALPRGGVSGRARPGDLERRDQLLVFDWHSGARITGMSVPGGVIDRLRAGPGSDHAAVALGDRVSLMDLRRGERGAGFSASAPVTALAISSDDGRLAVASEDGEVAVWGMDYRAPPTAAAPEDERPALAGRLRVLGEDEPALSAEDSAVVAVLPFDDREADGRRSRLIAELLTTQLANLDHLTLVERLRIDDLLRELDLRRRGITEDRGLELGRMLNADFVLLGSLGSFGSSYTLSARLLRVETGEVVSGRQVLCQECRAQELFDAVHLLGTTIAR